MDKIIVSGNKGFVGKNLVPYLLENSFQITGVSRSPKSTKEVSYKSLSVENWNNSLAIVHLAGKAHDLKNVADDSEYFNVNTELTKKLFNQFLKSKCKVFIYMSSVKAVADVVDGVLKEDEIPNPVTIYGKSKLAAEAYLLNQILPKDKKVYILRPCMIHGPGNKGNLNLLYKLVQKGIPYPLGAFDNKRSFLSIENLCFVIHQFLIKRPQSGIFNVADDTPISTNMLIEVIATVFGEKSKVLNVPKILVNACAKIGSLCKLSFNEERLQKLTENYVVSNLKIKQVLNIKLPISTVTGLSVTIKSFRDEL